MPNEIEGKLDAPAGKIVILVSRYNDSITSKLLRSALDTLAEHGVADEDIDVVWVPGAFELPIATERVVAGSGYVAAICLGAVIRGDTSHDQHINRAVSLALMEIGLRHALPVLFGVLTCETLEQAILRSGGGQGNKGVEAAETALRMVNLFTELPA